MLELEAGFSKMLHRNNQSYVSAQHRLLRMAELEIVEVQKKQNKKTKKQRNEKGRGRR